MTHSLLRTGALALALVAATFAPSARAQAPELAEKEQVALGKLLGKFLTAKAGDKAKEKAREDLVKELEKLGKKKGAKETSEALVAALSLSADLGRALYHAGEYKQNLRGGKPLTEELGQVPKTNYGLSLPSTYRAGGAPLPLILAIPEFKDGKPVSPAEFLTANLTEQEIREGAAIAAVPMPANKDDWNLLKEDRTGGVAMVMFTWGDVVKNVGIDADRIYLFGRGTEAITAAMHVATRYPHRFAGVIGMAGDAASDVTPANFGSLPTFFAGAGSNATSFESKAKELGYGNCTLKSDGTAADIWAWIGKTTRVATPLKVSFQPGDPFPDRAYWVRIPTTAGIASPVVAEADRATNTLKLSVPEVRSVTIYLNSTLIDFTKPVNLEINGKLRTEKIVPSVDDMLSLLSSSDNGRVYVTQRTYEVTQK
jgi:hypothetical protein